MAGGVGQLCVATLLDSGFRVRALVRSAERAEALFGKLPEASAKNLEIAAADLRDRDALAATRACEGVSAVISATGAEVGVTGGHGGASLEEISSLLLCLGGRLLRCCGCGCGVRHAWAVGWGRRVLHACLLRCGWEWL